MATLKEILNRDTGSMSADRAKRVEKAGLRASTLYVEGLEQEKADLEEKAEDCIDITATTDVNAGQKAVDNKIIAQKIEEYHAIKLKLSIVDRKLKVARATHKELKG